MLRRNGRLIPQEDLVALGNRPADPGRTQPSLCCAWCGMVLVGRLRTPDRRSPGEGRRTHVICPVCRARFFP